MQRLTLIIITLFLVSCDNLNLNLGKDKGEAKPKQNNVYTDIISDSILKDSNTESNDNEITVVESIEDTEQNQTVAVEQNLNDSQGTIDQQDTDTMINEVQDNTTDIDTTDYAAQNQKGMVKSTQIKPEMTQKKSVQTSSTPKVKHSDSSSSMIIVGDDGMGQGLSPRSYIHMSFAVFEKSSAAQFIEFQVYAVPIDSRLRRTGYYLLGYNKFARLIKGQAQFTRYWNGKNSRGQFLPKGKYNIYLWYKVKDSKGNVLNTGGRYWGNSKKYYLNLY